VGIDPNLLKEQCDQTLDQTDFDALGTREVGKVRDNYVTDERRFIVVTDRVSCFDVVVGTLPFKGQVLNQLAAFWFEATAAIAHNHLIAVPDPNVSVVQECRPLPVEFVFRGYLTGSTSTAIWTAYERGDRSYCGHALPDGLAKHERLREPLLTPTTKAPKGTHDELTSRAELIERGILSEEIYDEAAGIAGKLFAEGQRWAESRGMILADTKYEIGRYKGELTISDEINTPDSSRYWYTDTYQELFDAGEEQRKLDKEYVRTWLAARGFVGDGEIPVITDDIRVEAAKRYIKAYELITGEAFVVSEDPVRERVAAALSALA